jgi:hypothetical protein
MERNMRQRKYPPDTLADMFLLAAKLRNEMRAAGFTDNGGAIHSASRIMDLLGRRLNHEQLSHINQLKQHPDAECSEAAHLARQRGEAVLIEHVSPLRALTVAAIEHLDLVSEEGKREALKQFVREHYRLALLTPQETSRLNKFNRSRMSPDRLELAGIKMKPRSADA